MTKGRLATRRTFWAHHREISLNWIALGLLLAAWNAVDQDSLPAAARRPDKLRGYQSVSVRAVISQPVIKS